MKPFNCTSEIRKQKLEEFENNPSVCPLCHQPYIRLIRVSSHTGWVHGEAEWPDGTCTLMKPDFSCIDDEDEKTQREFAKMHKIRVQA
jgi:hypothetical protein